jgi:prepilin-type N-terminal cleavage/methylation domain-containing protein
LKILAKNAARPWGFTLIELLTVIAIIGVLATLLASALGTAKRKARQSVSVGNLRQISLAVNLYQDDHRKRPATYASLVREKMLTERSLICAEDRVTGNWAGLIEDSALMNFTRAPVAGETAEATPSEVAHSYFKAFDATDEVWEQIERDPLAGIAACQPHGFGRQSQDERPSISAYQGLVLRALKDMSVVNRQVFWQGLADKSDPEGASTSFLPPSEPSDLPFFLDEQQ